MKYDFETLVNRRSTGSHKWEGMYEQLPEAGDEVVPLSTMFTTGNFRSLTDRGGEQSVFRCGIGNRFPTHNTAEHIHQRRVGTAVRTIFRRNFNHIEPSDSRLSIVYLIYKELITDNIPGGIHGVLNIASCGKAGRTVQVYPLPA